jgi:two-component system chemotaxis sensor kinase CheA
VTALRERAVAAGLLSAEAAAELPEAQALDLVFHAGLSTRAEVTSTSGRGVGMDVVRSSVEQVGGSVEVHTTAGAGCLFRLNVPLTLAIMPVLVTRCGGGRYAVPQVHLREVVQLDAQELAGRVDVVQDTRLLRLRGRLLPLVDLAGLLSVAPLRLDGLIVVVVETDGRRFGLVVDDVGDTVDAVVKPLPRLLRALPVYAGTTILGDGPAALVLDVAGVASGAGVPAGDGSDETTGAAPASTAGLLLLATAPDGGRLAVRLAQVRRLEVFAVGDLERAGDVEVVQYGDQLLPLVRVADVLPERRSARRDGAAQPGRRRGRDGRLRDRRGRGRLRGRLDRRRRPRAAGAPAAGQPAGGRGVRRRRGARG